MKLTVKVPSSISSITKEKKHAKKQLKNWTLQQLIYKGSHFFKIKN